MPETLLALKKDGYLLGIVTDTANSISAKLSWFERGGFGHVWDSIISSRALSPRAALSMTALAEFSGPFIFGVAVANTIGNEVIVAEAITIQVLLAALSSAIFWNLLTWYLGFPSSSSHAMIGGFIGAVVGGASWHAVKLSGLWKILFALFASPIIGFIFGFILLRVILLLVWYATPRINNFSNAVRC